VQYAAVLRREVAMESDQVYFVDRLPMTGSGKIQKYLLREEARRLGARAPVPAPT
jgi:acyl-coenzyme A synthetase/AMP-(fatty) acid ligase